MPVIFVAGQCFDLEGLPSGRAPVHVTRVSPNELVFSGGDVLSTKQRMNLDVEIRERDLHALHELAHLFCSAERFRKGDIVEDHVLCVERHHRIETEADKKRP